MTDSSGQLRETVVQAALSLLAEWDTVTTAQIARAASIDEATLLRVFDDKDAVFTSAIQTILDPTPAVQELQAIPLDQPLTKRLVEAIGALDAHNGRMVAFLAPLGAASNPRRQPTTSGEPHTRQPDRGDFRAASRMEVISQAVATLMEPDQKHLRLPTTTLADAFLGLYSGRKRTRHPELRPDQLVDLFLNGASTPTNRS